MDPTFDTVPFRTNLALAYVNRSEEEQLRGAGQEMAPLAVQLADSRVLFWVVVGVAVLWLAGSKRNFLKL